MDLLKKLFKAFNSAQTPWQMSLALSLGMAMGLTPFSGLQTIALIFLVFIINIHLGLFLVSSTFFAGIAYIADPMFEQLGFAILTNESLEELFISFYNSGFIRLTYFNNTLVMGSSLIAFTLLIPMYFILNKVVYLYRDKIAAKLSQYRIFKILGVEVTDKKDKIIRIWGAGVFVALSIIVGVFGYLFMDTLAKSALRAGLAKVTSKNVDIASVDVSFSNSRLDINALDIYDAKESSFKSENIAINIDFNQLLFQKYHIENIDIVGMRFNEPRTHDAKGAVESASSLSNSSSSSTKASSSKNNHSENSSVASAFPTPQTLIDRAGLSSVKTVDDAKVKLKAIEKKYTDALEKDFSDKEIKSIKNDLKYLRQKVKAKDTSTITADIKKIKQLRDTLKEKKRLASQLKKDFKADKKAIKIILKDVKKAGLSDYANLSENYKLDAKGGVNVVGVLFGDKTKSFTSSFLKYYKMVKPYLSDDAKEEVIPPRGEGRWVKYKELNSQVDTWVKNVDITGIYDGQAFNANIKDISSNQKLLVKPMTLVVKSEGGLLKGLDLGLTKLENASYTFRADAKTNDYESVDAKAKLAYTKTKFSSKYLDDVNSFDVDMKLQGKVESPKFDISSNLDEKLKKVFAKVLKQKVAKYKKELKNIIDKNTKDSLASLTGDSDAIEAIEKKLNAKLGGVQSSENDLDNTESKLKDNAKSKLKSKASKFLKKFKF